jgi:hypothetical protein
LAFNVLSLRDANQVASGVEHEDISDAVRLGGRLLPIIDARRGDDPLEGGVAVVGGGVRSQPAVGTE